MVVCGKRRVVVGDDLGYVECFEMKQGHVASRIFKQKVGDSPITSIAVDGNRIFASLGQTVVGLQRKGGKQFFRMDSSLVETISKVSVDGSILFTSCEYAYCKYDDGRDDGFFMCHDEISAMVVGPGHQVVLACTDGSLTAIGGESRQLCGTRAMPSNNGKLGAFTALERIKKESSFDVAFGTASGFVGIARCLFEGTFSVELLWHAGDEGQSSSRVQCVDVNASGDALVCGRADGRVQVYESGGGGRRFRVVFESQLKGAVQSVAYSPLVSKDHPDIVCCTFGGTIVALVPPSNEDDDERGARSPRSSADFGRLKEEIEMLEARANAAKSDPSTLVAPRFEPRTEFALDAENACYRVTIELPVPIESVVLKSSVRIELLSLEGKQALAHASPVEARHQTKKHPIAFACLLRCHQGDDRNDDKQSSNVITFELRTVEGEPGELTAMVIANSLPRKSGQLVSFEIKPLSLHRRIATPSSEEDAAVYNELNFTGTFSSQMFHDWVAGSLPDVPSRPTKDRRLTFRNVYTQGIFDCQYSEDGRARVVSDSLSALAIFKEYVAKEAVRDRISVRDEVRIEEGTIPIFLAKLQPKLAAQLDLARRFELIDAVKEIYLSEESSSTSSSPSWISEEFKYIYDNAESIKAAYEQSSSGLDYLTGILTDYYVDRCKFAGVDARRKIPQLEALVRGGSEAYDSTKLVDFFCLS